MSFCVKKYRYFVIWLIKSMKFNLQVNINNEWHCSQKKLSKHKSSGLCTNSPITLHYDPSRSTKVGDFHLMWQDICHFILVINSNLGPISHRSWDMDQFSIGKRTFFLPLHPFNLQFETVPLALNGRNFACPSSTHMANYSWKKFSLTPHRLATMHPLRTNRHTDRQTTTMPMAEALLMYGRLIRTCANDTLWKTWTQ